MKRGFTLMEVLLALLLLALLLSLVQGAYSGAVRSRERSRVETEEAHLAAVVLQKIAGELSMAVLPSGTDPVGFIVEGDGVSSVSFVTRVPRISGFSLGGAAAVDYALEDGEDGSSNLVRRETPETHGDLADGGVPYEILRDVARFEVLCYDGNEWLTGWDSQDRGGPPYLPIAVSVELAWGGEEEDDEAPERIYRTSTPVYAARRTP